MFGRSGQRSPASSQLTTSIFSLDLDSDDMFEKITSWFSSSTPAKDDKPYNPSDPKQNPLNPKGLKPCCACPETKRLRDDCFIRYDPSEAEGKCKEELANHIACMRGLGFKV